MVSDFCRMYVPDVEERRQRLAAGRIIGEVRYSRGQVSVRLWLSWRAFSHLADRHLLLR